MFACKCFGCPSKAASRFPQVVRGFCRGRNVCDFADPVDGSDREVPVRGRGVDARGHAGAGDGD